MAVSTGSLQFILNGLVDGTITIIDGDTAYITRQKYANKYISFLPNPLQFYPMFNYNLATDTFSIVNTDDISFTATDLFIGNDWFVTNQLLVLT